jgi:hypothetical protein
MKNWKTTVLGIVAIIFGVLANFNVFDPATTTAASEAISNSVNSIGTQDTLFETIMTILSYIAGGALIVARDSLFKKKPATPANSLPPTA